MAAPVAGYLYSRFGKSQSPIGLLAIDVDDLNRKSQSVIGFSGSGELLVENMGAIKVDAEALFDCLSFTHILQLLPLDDDLQRTFYAFEAIRGTWSVRELQRQIESLYYARSGLSKNPHKLSQLTHVKADKLNVANFVKTENVLEFIDPKLFVSKFQLRLPSKEEVTAFLQKENVSGKSSVSPRKPMKRMSKADKDEFKKLGITFEEKAFYDVLLAIRDSHGFEYPEDKCKLLAKKIKSLIDGSSVFADWLNNTNIRNRLAHDLTILLYENGYPPEWDQEVFEKILVQVENYKRNEA